MVSWDSDTEDEGSSLRQPSQRKVNFCKYWIAVLQCFTLIIDFLIQVKRGPEEILKELSSSSTPSPWIVSVKNKTLTFFELSNKLFSRSKRKRRPDAGRTRRRRRIRTRRLKQGRLTGLAEEVVLIAAGSWSWDGHPATSEHQTHVNYIKFISSFPALFLNVQKFLILRRGVLSHFFMLV